MSTKQIEWVTINSVPTKIVTWGRTLRSTSVSDAVENLNYIILITGNPGVLDTYLEFLEEIYKKTNYNVWGIGHAGHDIDRENEPPQDKNNHLYGLQGQIKHKESFIEDFVPKNAKITLIGHSIGSYIILKLLGIPSINCRVINSYLLFPTIERMAESPNGKLFMGVYRHLFFFMFLLIRFFNLLPLFIQNFLIYVYCKFVGLPDKYIEIIRNFIHPFTIGNAINMASEEMLKVKERDNEILKENINTIRLYYGACDGWVPHDCYYNLKRYIPNIKAEICDKGFAHAFVLRDSVPMANILIDWIKVQ